MIELESRGTIKASREAVWRHLTRISDWYRWYPGLHGTTASESLTRSGQSWRSTGQMGRMLYRGDQFVAQYRLLDRIEIEGARYPWLRYTIFRFELRSDGPNSELTVNVIAEPGLWLVGRLLLQRTLRSRLQAECDAIAQRLKDYVEGTMPYH